MYCEKCRRQLYYQDLNKQGWCFTCGKIVDVADCKVSQWNLYAVFMLLWTLQI